MRDYHVGGFHVFGASQPAPSVLLNSGYGTVILGQPFSAAFLINRLQAMSAVPLLNTADFETGVGFRIFGATAFPRQMAMGAIAGDDDLRLVREEARITGIESRALGVQVNFAPVADVNNNPRNPVINTRSYGEDPARVAALGRRLRRRRARRRHDRDDQALSRARRHRRRQPSRAAGDHVRPRAARSRRARAVQARHRRRAPRR